MFKKGFKMNGSVLLLALCLAIVVRAEDIPCLAKAVDLGFVCVCNETYCDTIENPTPVKFPSFYQYSTSETVPGFTKALHKKSYMSVEKGASDVTVTVNVSMTYQMFGGMGVALSDNSGIDLQTLSPITQDIFAETVFGETGLGMTYLRLPISGSDFSNRYYSYDDVPGDTDLKYWNLTAEDTEIKIPLLKKFQSAYKRGDMLKILATTWTAPSWMKNNNAARQGYLRNQYMQTWANYHLKFLQAYEKEGVKIWGLALGNEVVLSLYFGLFFGMPNMIMMPNQARDWVKNYLEPTLKKSGYESLKLYSLEDERPFANWWQDRLLKDKEVAQLMSGVTIHWYLDSNMTIKILEDLHKKYPDQEILYTESSINSFQSQSGQPVDYGSWNSGVRYINNMFQNLCHWVQAYVDWNVALNIDGGPKSTENMTLDASIIVNGTISEFYKQPIFYVLGHFAKFIQPGGYRVQTLVKQTTNDSWSEECYSVPVTSHRKTRLPVLHNEVTTTTASPFPTRAPDPPSTTVLVLAVLNPDKSRSIITYNPRTTAANIVIKDTGKKGKKITATLQPHSMNTFVYW